MQAWLRWIRAHLWGLAVGATVTLAMAVAYPMTWRERFSLSLLDYKFKHFNPIEADSRIVMIDINDFAIENIERWPWHRRRCAELIDTLHELGAKAALMDLVLDTPEEPRINDPRLAADADVDSVGELLGGLGPESVIRDDDEFHRVLETWGNVYLGAFARDFEPGHSPDEVREKAYVVFEADPKLSEEAFDRRMRLAMPRGTDWMPRVEGRAAQMGDRVELFEQWRIEYEIEKDFGLTRMQLAEKIGFAPSRVEDHLAKAKLGVARRLVRKFWNAHPDAVFPGCWPDIFADILPGKSLSTVSQDHDDLLRAARAVWAEWHTIQHAPLTPPELAGAIRGGTNFRLPLDKFVIFAKAGLVVFDTDPADGVMRRLPIVMNGGGRLIKHLGFAVACDVLDIDDASFRLEEGNCLGMTSRDGSSRWRLQIDGQGRTLINWHSDRKNPDLWDRSFDHLPVGLVLSIPINRRRIEEAQGREALTKAQFVELARRDSGDVLRDYDTKVRARKQWLWDGATAESSPELAQLEADIGRIEGASIAVVREWGKELHQALGEHINPADLEDDQERAIARLSDIDLDALHAETQEFVEQRREEMRSSLGQLRQRINGKICLVGYTATAVADTVNTPVFDEVPGVMAHANVINSMLQNRFPRQLPTWFDIVMILAAGVAVTVVTTWRDPWVSLVTMLLVVVVLLVVAFSAFYLSVLHIDIIGPLIAGFGSWAFVTLYRQLTEERAKRAFSKSLAQYTSPAIAARLADQLARQSGTLDLTPQARQVTCFFSDLKGFTSISERLGAARTREVLNPYLEAMSRVLIQHNAMINKFMGDGIFAFFNPPVNPVTDHARAACEATLDSFTALERLKKDLGHGELEKEVQALRMRIGVNTGEVFVGDYGSSNKLDYTCIGDTVNLSARLEPACKPFGISAMVSETTLQAAGHAAYIVRHLGGLQVVGKKQAVQVYELIARKGEAENEIIEYAALFGQSVREFQQRDWPAALRTLATCRQLRPDDLAIDLLEENIRHYEQSPPPDDWNQAIELTSK